MALFKGAKVRCEPERRRAAKNHSIDEHDIMKISTRGRYALRVIIDLAEHHNGEYMPMKVVAERQHISLKYIEQIVPVLTKNNYIEGVHGKGGGYRLKREPSDITVGELLRLTEGSLAPVACLECDAQKCENCEQCRTLPMWKELYGVIRRYLDSVTISSLMWKSVATDELDSEKAKSCFCPDLWDI